MKKGPIGVFLRIGIHLRSNSATDTRDMMQRHIYFRSFKRNYFYGMRRRATISVLTVYIQALPSCGRCGMRFSPQNHQGRKA